LHKIKTNMTLPTTSELYSDNLEIAFKNDQFNLLLNQPPKADWIKQNKYANNSNYIPIGIVETLLQKIFKRFRVEVLREGTMFNSVYVTIRLHYWNGTDNTWQFHDGVGAVQLQTKQGSSPAQLENINNNAVMMALPMAKSYAIKDACEHIGKIFGRDINRQDVMAFSQDNSISKEMDSKSISRLKTYINDCQSLEQLLSVQDLAIDYNLIDLFNEKKEALNG
jgi:hypothetical protein